MARTPVGEKIRTLAMGTPALQAFFGINPFRWVAKWPLTQGYLPKRRGDPAPGGGTSSVRTKLISAISQYAQEGPSILEQCRVQIDVLDLSPETCDRAAFAVEDFLGTINCVTGQQFGSPTTTPNQFPNFLTNRREFEEPQPGAVVYGVSVDVVLYNSTLN